jgi:branched-chain amino acid aminotransferase
MQWVFLNGAIVEADKAVVPVTDRGLLLGDGLFETMRAYGGRTFKMEAHLDRLRSSAKVFRLPFDFADAKIADAIGELIKRNQCPDAYIRLTLTRGSQIPELSLADDGAPTVIIIAWPLRPHPSKRYSRGVRLIISTVRQHSASSVVRHKTLNYLANLLARQEATDAGAGGAILLNETGQVTEESVSNLFFVKSGTLWTPPVHCGLLPGITRALVLELAAAAGIVVEDKPILAGEVFEFEECFMTNSLMELMPVRSIDKRPIGTAPGEMTKRLQARFTAEVEREA